MQEGTEGPIFLIEALLFVLRCLVPLLLMLGLSYILKRLGLIKPPPPPPPGRDNGNNKTNGGGVAHGGQSAAALVIAGMLMVVWGLACGPVAAPLSSRFGPPAQQTGNTALMPRLIRRRSQRRATSLHLARTPGRPKARPALSAKHAIRHQNPSASGDRLSDARELSRSYYEACQKCHPANYEKPRIVCTRRPRQAT
jgi:hypothetical protein